MTIEPGTAETRTRETNDERAAKKIRREIQRAHEWRVQVWAQNELRIRAKQDILGVMGMDRVDLFQPNFTDDAMLHHYGEMKLTK